MPIPDSSPLNPAKRFTIFAAIITNKGISNRSAKDLIDLLAKTDEEIDFFCIHDFDASGTMIYQSLQNETKSRGARKVKIIDLGLKYEDVEKLNLEIEKTKYKKRQPVAKDYEEYKDWLQHNRVELNAMDSPTFIKWIRSKLDEYNKGKVIPPENYMKNFIIAEGQSKLRQLIREKIENQLNIDELIDKNFEGQYQKLEKILNYNDLNQIVKNKLTIVPENNWRAPLDIEITKIINKMMESLEIVI